MKTFATKTTALALGAPLAVVACVNEPAPTSQSNAEEIIGGFPASSPQLDAVGALGIPASAIFEDEQSGNVPSEVADERDYLDERMQVRQEAEYLTFCTGTLIAEDVVVTAEHCVDDLRGDEEFLIGFDGMRPDDARAVADVMAEDTIEGGAVGFGADIALVYLEEPIDYIEPAEMARVADDNVGENFVNIGYGVRNNDEDSGLRFLGMVELRGIAGNMADNLYGDFDGFLEHVDELGIAAPPEDIYEMLELLDVEATFGHQEGNAQSCFGDSGGPVMRDEGGQLTVYGVVSWGLGTDELICDWGGNYVIVEDVVEDFIEKGLACPGVPASGTCEGNAVVACEGNSEDGYEQVEEECGDDLVCGEDGDGQAACIDDACDGVTEAGMCEGDTVLRCTADNEGDRRVVETDCSTLGLTCGEDDAGDKTCVDGDGANGNGNGNGDGN